jgi:XamI restriction endonuclease
MAVNANKTERWKEDTRLSVDFYNEWFLEFAPLTYREERAKATRQIEYALQKTANFTNVTPEVLMENPQVVQMLRMGTAPPIARDRLIGLAGVDKSMIERMEKEDKLPARMNRERLVEQLQSVAAIVMRLADKDVFTWLESGETPSEEDLHRAATVVADRLTGAVSDPIVRNAQERRQLSAIEGWLMARGYRHILPGEGLKFDAMEPGTFSFRLNVPVKLAASALTINIPVDTVVKPIGSKPEDMPLLIEAKSAGDFTNVNKRRKEEAQKHSQLKYTYGSDVQFILFLCGYFDGGYLGYEAAEGIDWVWEHRIDDLAGFGL